MPPKKDPTTPHAARKIVAENKARRERETIAKITSGTSMLQKAEGPSDRAVWTEYSIGTLASAPSRDSDYSKVEWTDAR